MDYRSDKCLNCGAELKSNQRLYCSKKCSRHIEYLRHKAKPFSDDQHTATIGEVDKCAACGKEFKRIAGNQRYCSSKCCRAKERYNECVRRAVPVMNTNERDEYELKMTKFNRRKCMKCKYHGNTASDTQAKSVTQVYCNYLSLTGRTCLKSYKGVTIDRRGYEFDNCLLFEEGEKLREANHESGRISPKG